MASDQLIRCFLYFRKLLKGGAGMADKDFENLDEGVDEQKENEVKVGRLQYLVDQNGVVHNVKWVD
jgi:hypothetical protein